MFFFFNDTATTEIYTLSLHDALPILVRQIAIRADHAIGTDFDAFGRVNHGEAVDVCSGSRSEEHTSELQSLTNLVCRLLLEKKKKNKKSRRPDINNNQQTNKHHIRKR